MALLDTHSSSSVRRAITPRRATRGTRVGATQAADATSSKPVLGSSLDPTDRLILSLERQAPGPHHDDAGISHANYMARLRRLLYDREANEYAPAVLARLRVELTAGEASQNR